MKKTVTSLAILAASITATAHASGNFGREKKDVPVSVRAKVYVACVDVNEDGYIGSCDQAGFIPSAVKAKDNCADGQVKILSLKPIGICVPPPAML